MTTAEEVLHQFTPGRLIEADIRAAIDARLDRGMSGSSAIETAREVLHAIISQNAADPLVDSAADTLERSHGVWEPLNETHEFALFADLRPSEAARLIQLIEAACDRAEARCVEAILGELTSAASEFLREFPAARLAERAD